MEPDLCYGVSASRLLCRVLPSFSWVLVRFVGGVAESVGWPRLRRRSSWLGSIAVVLGVWICYSDKGFGPFDFFWLFVRLLLLKIEGCYFRNFGPPLLLLCCKYLFIVNRFLLGFVERCREICTLDWIGVKVCSWFVLEMRAIRIERATCRNLDWDKEKSVYLDN